MNLLPNLQTPTIIWHPQTRFIAVKVFVSSVCTCGPKLEFKCHCYMCQQQYDEKNIRRRVYDALNVLMAMDIISKDKKEIQWKGLPRTSLNDIEELKVGSACLLFDMHYSSLILFEILCFRDKMRIFL